MVTQLTSTQASYRPLRPDDPRGKRPAGRHVRPRRSWRPRRPRLAPNYVRRWRVEVAVGAVVLVVVATLLTAWPAATPPRASVPGIDLVRSGVVMSDPFDRPLSQGQLMDHYVFNGSAGPGAGWVRATARALDVGVRPHGGWAGWFAVTLDAAGPGVVWHTTMSRPRRPLSAGEGEAVFAVQTASTQHSGAINYVVVSALSTRGKGEWLVGYAHGVVANADTEVLWRSPLRADAPTSEPVTIGTDGRRSLVVWLGNRRVYSSNRLHLDVPAPFQAYLEVQSRNVGYVSSFHDFWVADASPVTVTGVAPGARLRLVNAGGVVTAIAGPNGAASLFPPSDVLVGTGTLTVTGKGRSRRFPDFRYAGGDVWHLGAG